MTQLEHTIRLQLGLKNAEWMQNIVLEDIGGFEDQGMTTLKDISIILYCMCGNGVIWNLAKELEKKIGVSVAEIERALCDILEEYYEMDDEEAFKKAFPKTALSLDK